MSNTIQRRHYSSREASILQKLPYALHDDADECASSQVTVGPDYVVYAGEYYPAANVTGGTINFLATGTSAAQYVHVISLRSRWPVSTDPMVMLVSDEQVEPAARWTKWIQAASEALTKQLSPVESAPSAAARLRVERLATLQATLGLSIKEMAEVLGITRQGLYKWLDSSNEIKLQESSRIRLGAVERLAKRWRELTAIPLSSVAHEPLPQGGSALDLLCADPIDETKAIEGLAELSGKLENRPKSLSRLMKEAGYTRRRTNRSLSDDE